MKLKNILFLLFVTIFLGCEDNEILIDTDNLLVGIWVEPVYDGENITFKRDNSLPNESYGVSFTKEGVFTERTSGFCGTPPLSFFNNTGSWEMNKNVIEISKQSYTNSFGWRIIEITEATLFVKREVTAQEIEHQNLMELFNEITNLAYSETCGNATDWSFVGYGAQACGGFQGYIPYSKNIDTVSFLNKIDAYTKAEKEYNIKFQIISSCSLIATPTSVACNNGYPTLIY